MPTTRKKTKTVKVNGERIKLLPVQGWAVVYSFIDDAYWSWWDEKVYQTKKAASAKRFEYEREWHKEDGFRIRVVHCALTATLTAKKARKSK
jgi:hypothetical protein